MPVLALVLEQRHGHAFGQPVLGVLAERVAAPLAVRARNSTASPTSGIADTIGHAAGRGYLEGS